MDRIFLYTDSDNDSVHVWDENPEDLVIKNIPDHGGTAAVRLDRDAVLRLHTALGKWISGDDTPVYGADTLYGQLIQQAVAAEVARVLPLHQAPMAAVEPCQHCQDDGYECRPEFTSDPEPHDVGHPVYEDVPAPRQTVPVGPMYCGPCGHHRNEHMGVLGGCWGSFGSCECTNNPDAPVPVAKSDKVWGEQGTPPVSCTCDHAAMHHSTTSGGCDYLTCKCLWTSAS